MTNITERFIRYAKIDTQSDEESTSSPSAEKELVLALLLKKEMEEMGISDIRLTEKGVLYGFIPSNLPEEKKKSSRSIGLIAHMDTAPSAPGENVSPEIIRNYDGNDIPLKNGSVIRVKDYPALSTYRGLDLITTDGNTLLGADDKAGIAEIMEAAETILKNPDIPHGEISLSFTPDEEIGRGTDSFDLKEFHADAAYTVDGGPLSEIEYENFNAAAGTVNITGVNIHPGSGKNKMINASLLAMEYNALLPPCTPANTEGYEGFFHLCSLSGTESGCVMKYIIRDHDRNKFAEKKKMFAEAAETLNRKYSGTDTRVTVNIRDQYYNMKEIIEKNFYLIEHAKKAFADAGLTPATVPIRGGTDGAMLSYKGLPCPNLCTGGENYHSVYEYISVQSMEKMTQVLVNLIASFAE